MRNRTKKCIVLLLAILLLCLCVWRLTPRTFGQMTGADPQTISSLSGTAYDGRSVTLILVWGTSADETCSLVMTGGQIVVGRPNHDGFLIYHLLDTTLLDQLTEYLMTHGEKG